MWRAGSHRTVGGSRIVSRPVRKRPDWPCPDHLDVVQDRTDYAVMDGPLPHQGLFFTRRRDLYFTLFLQMAGNSDDFLLPGLPPSKA